MMKQWHQMKEEIGKDTILFCRVGDFYELFYEDAVIGAKELDITLTARKIRDTEHPLAGVPFRSVEGYIGRLVKKGYKVAVADQLEDPKATKGVVQRGVTRIVTRGTLLDDSILDVNQNNYIASVCQRKIGKTTEIGFSLADLSCGEFYAKSYRKSEGLKELSLTIDATSPVEYVYPDFGEEMLEQITGKTMGENETLSPRPEYWFDVGEAKQILHTHFGVKSLNGFGIEDSEIAVGAAGALLRYLDETQKQKAANITKIQLLDSSDRMMLDRSVIRSLELLENNINNKEEGTLFSMLHHTVTPMGARLLRKWIVAPLTNIDHINQRLQAVQTLINDEISYNQLHSELNRIGDLERLTTKISLRSAKPPEIIRLAQGLEKIPEIHKQLDQLEAFDSAFPTSLKANISACDDITGLIRKTLQNNPTGLGDGEVIAEGVNERLDELRRVLREGEKWVERFIAREIQKTGINSLKVKQNRQLGYYIEVTKSNLNKVPEHYTKRQAMVNVSRYITQELKDWEGKILNAEIEITELEQQLYNALLEELSTHTQRLQNTSKGIAELDCLSTFAYVSLKNNYTRPILSHEKGLNIEGVRHPIIEEFKKDIPYTPNDVFMEEQGNQILIITGPNFSGKSSLLRAVALATILAQIGCFVPSTTYTCGIIDRIFTRIGASDNLIAGQSTFMVEMMDAANLVNNSTKNSLIIADELGRGTSTYDGLAIAWSISEYLHESPNRPFTIIATHFHQLAELEGLLPRVKNYHFNILFDGKNRPIFDHKLFSGSSDKSFGVEVAKLAGLPKEVILRARFLLTVLEAQSASITAEEEETISSKVKKAEKIAEDQMTLNAWLNSTEAEPRQVVSVKKKIKTAGPVLKAEESEILSTLRSLDINHVSPLQAFEILQNLTKLLRGE